MSTHVLNPRLGVPRPRAGVGWPIALGGAVGAVSALAAVLLGPAALLVPPALGIVALLVRFPQALLVVYVYIGIFKGEAVVSDLPFDVTPVLAGLVVLVCLHRVLEGRVHPLPIGYVALLLLIGSMLAISLSWTPVPDYGGEKVLKFLTLTPIAALAPFFLIENRRDLRYLLYAVVGLAAFAALVALTSPGDPTAGRIEFGGNENTIFTSRLLCAGALVLLFAPALGLPRRLRLIAPLLGLGLVAAAAGIGSRGPIIALAFALVCVVTASTVRSPRQLPWILVVVAAGIAIFPLIQLPETSRQRLEEAAQNPTETLAQDGRSRLYTKAIELTAENPVLGYGSGGFFLYSWVLIDQEEKYPHNMFLELSSEVGLAPAVALGVAVLFVLVALSRRAWIAPNDLDRRLIFVVGGLFLLNLFEVQFSGDINDNRVFWLTFGIAWLVALNGVPEPSTGPGPLRRPQ